MAKKRHPLTECSNCGAEFRAGRLACPECGSDAETGWKSAEDIEYESVEIPDYFPHGPIRRRPSILVVSLIVILVLVLIGLLS